MPRPSAQERVARRCSHLVRFLYLFSFSFSFADCSFTYLPPARSLPRVVLRLVTLVGVAPRFPRPPAFLCDLTTPPPPSLWDTPPSPPGPGA